MTASLAGHLTAAPLLLLGLWALAAPAAWRNALLALPRSKAVGWSLTVVSLVWFAWNVWQSPLGVFDSYKVWLYPGTPVVIFLVIRYLDDLLGARALAGILLLWPGTLLDAIRPQETPLRLALVVYAYALVVIGCYVVSGPHRFRRWTAWAVASDTRARTAGAGLLALGLAFAAIVLTSFRGP